MPMTACISDLLSLEKTLVWSRRSCRRPTAKWKDEVTGLAGETARSPQELAYALYYLASAGLKSSQVMPILAASAKAAAPHFGMEQGRGKRHPPRAGRAQVELRGPQARGMAFAERPFRKPARIATDLCFH